MKKSVKITLLFLSFTCFLNAQKLTPSEFIDVAGKQRMLSQKIAKSYLISSYSKFNDGYTISPQVSIDYKIGVSVFKRNLEMLFNNINLNSNKEVYRLLNDEKEAWQDLQNMLEEERTVENVVKVIQLANQLLIKSDKVVKAAQESFTNNGSEKDLLTLINKSGKQRMLSQRLCMLFMTKTIQSYLPQKKKKIIDFDVSAVFNQMDEAIGDLLITPFNYEAQTENKIGEISVEFDRLKDKKSLFVNGKLNVNDVFNTTNKLTNLFNELTRSYSKI